MLLLVSLALAIYYLLASIYFAIAIAFAAKAAPTEETSVLVSRQALWLDSLCSCCCPFLNLRALCDLCGLNAFACVFGSCYLLFTSIYLIYNCHRLRS